MKRTVLMAAMAAGWLLLAWAMAGCLDTELNTGDSGEGDADYDFHTGQGGNGGDLDAQDTAYDYAYDQANPENEAAAEQESGFVCQGGCNTAKPYACAGGDWCACEAGVWTPYSCAEICKGQGKCAAGCGDAGLSYPYCVCSGDPAACQPKTDGDFGEGDNGTGEDGDAGDRADYYETTDVEGPPLDAKCAPLKAGWNENFSAGGKTRRFMLDLPAAVQSRRGWPVVFVWHGSGDTADNMHQIASYYVNDADFSFIAVTPGSLKLSPPAGLEWDMLTVTKDNAETALFDEILRCIENKWGVDNEHVHTLGFSAGAITSDMLGVLRGGTVASIVSWSGGYFSNPANLTGGLGSYVSWPPIDQNAHYVQLLVHGGTSDSWSAVVINVNFNQMGTNDVPYLNQNGHDVIHCNHGGGHTLPDGLQGAQALEFFRDHPKSVVDSPYADGLPGDFPGYCSFSGKK